MYELSFLYEDSIGLNTKVSVEDGYHCVDLLRCIVLGGLRQIVTISLSKVA